MMIMISKGTNTENDNNDIADYEMIAEHYKRMVENKDAEIEHLIAALAKAYETIADLDARIEENNAAIHKELVKLITKTRDICEEKRAQFDYLREMLLAKDKIICVLNRSFLDKTSATPPSS
ncbi:cyun50 [Cyclophragma undans nucleopolyhedrovirus]|uniref:Cyun50 n=1 Tax=Cyclophragma undans nucleopolyhedrovirus TaxID=1906244 RepID=A0A288Q7H8_9ABAC|nr:cyun50 [Cyclophragma undans nucleopolyhedrovirus]AOT85520.1 cyun50 [Cyclophragma undans nucleopolyhedrovirus]